MTKILAGLVVVLLLILVWSERRAGQANAVSLAALAHAQSELHLAQDSVVALQWQVQTAKARVDTIRLRSNQTVAHADSWQRVADSIRHTTAFVAADTIPICQAMRQVLDAKTSECAQLRIAVAQKDTAITVGQIALVEARSSLLTLGRQLDSVQAQHLKIAPPYQCKILFIACPSRTLMFALGALGGFAARKL